MMGPMQEEDIDGLLVEYALGTLSDEERAAVEVALAHTPTLVARVKELEASMSLVTMSMRPPPAPWSQVRASLEGGKRFAHLLPALAQHFDISEAQAAALADAVDSPSNWFDGLAPGVSLMPVEAGPRWDGYVTTLVRLEPGAQLPLHTHGSREQVLVLEGGYRDDQSGVEFWRGEVDVRDEGTSHSFTAVAGPACLCASVVKLAGDA
jgi:putative transcriptional regulator